MARGFPSMTALLGLLAVAGYQNREKLGELLGNYGSGGAGGPADPSGGQARPKGLDGLLGNLTGAVGGGGLGSRLGGGLNELRDRFQQNGHAETVNSWVTTGPNRSVAPDDLEQALGPEVIGELSQRTGLSREELLSRLSRDLPDAVDRYTPEGRVPAEQDMKA